MLVSSTIWGPMIQKLELKSLCSLILEKTINDPDKYQSGRTKIFFRAGMLAALESFRSGRLNAMVTVVQKNMRRHMAVKHYQELRRATIKIQTWWRGITAKRFVQHVRRETAAIRLQKAARTFVQRKRFVDVRLAVVRFQSRTSQFRPFTSPSHLLCRRSRCAGSSCIQRKKAQACYYTFANSFAWSVSPDYSQNSKKH